MTLNLLTFLLSSALAAEEPSTLDMTELGVAARLPPGWTVPRWSDWDLEALDGGPSVMVRVLSTDLQVEVNEASAREWAAWAVGELEGTKHTDGRVEKTWVGDCAGRPCAHAQIGFQYDGKLPATMLQRSWTGAGHAIHLRATAVNQNRAKAVAAMDTWQAAMTFTKEPLALPSGPVAAGADFGANLPEGWRAPVLPERAVVAGLARKVGEEKLDPDWCWSAIKPHGHGSPSVIVACQKGTWLGKVDEHSFAGVEAELRPKLFGAAPVGAATPAPLGTDGRLVFVWKPEGGGELAVRVAAVPYHRGIVKVTALGRHEDLAELEAGLAGVLQGWTFSGEDDRHPVGGADWWNYVTKYRRTDPVVLGPLALVAVGVVGMGLRLRGRKPRYED